MPGSLAVAVMCLMFPGSHSTRGNVYPRQPTDGKQLFVLLTTEADLSRRACAVLSEPTAVSCDALELPKWPLSSLSYNDWRKRADDTLEHVADGSPAATAIGFVLMDSQVPDHLTSQVGRWIASRRIAVVHMIRDQQSRVDRTWALRLHRKSEVRYLPVAFDRFFSAHFEDEYARVFRFILGDSASEHEAHLEPATIQSAAASAAAPAPAPVRECAPEVDVSRAARERARSVRFARPDACLHNTPPTGAAEVHLRGHPHSGTNHMRLLVSTLLFHLATTALENSCFWTTDTPHDGVSLTANLTYFAGPGIKHAVDLAHFKGNSALHNIVDETDARLKAVVGKNASVMSAMLARHAPACLGAKFRRARFLLVMRNPISIALSTIGASKVSSERVNRATLHACAAMVPTLAAWVSARFLWYQRVLAADDGPRTFVWYYELDEVEQCHAFTEFLGYDARHGALCDAVVQSNTRATMAAISGVATRKGTQQEKHRVSSNSTGELGELLECTQIRELSNAFWADLPGALQKHWRAWLRPNCSSSDDLR